MKIKNQLFYAEVSKLVRYVMFFPCSQGNPEIIKYKTYVLSFVGFL